MRPPASGLDWNPEVIARRFPGEAKMGSKIFVWLNSSTNLNAPVTLSSVVNEPYVHRSQRAPYHGPVDDIVALWSPNVKFFNSCSGIPLIRVSGAHGNANSISKDILGTTLRIAGKLWILPVVHHAVPS